MEKERDLTIYQLTKYPGVSFVLKDDYDSLKQQNEGLREALNNILKKNWAEEHRKGNDFFQAAREFLAQSAKQQSGEEK